MKIAGQDHAAFLLSSGQAAVAQHAKPTDKCAPMVQIMSLGMGVCVCGVEALEALRQAIDYAIDGPEA
jgi:hypothetical protein